MLDGMVITKSERIAAEQEYAANKARFDSEYGVTEKEATAESTAAQNDATGQEQEPKKKGTTSNGKDGRWYTHINECDDEKKEPSENENKFRKPSEGDDELLPHTPEARLAAARELAAKSRPNLNMHYNFLR
jgi:hypothetical protein